MKSLAAILTALVSPYSALLLFTPLPWENIWSELTIEDWDDVNHKEAFEGWARRFGRTYESLEVEAERFLIWMDNWYFVNKHNMESHSHTLKMNQFSDLAPEEFRSHIHGSADSCLKGSDFIPVSSNTETKQYDVNATVPAAFDWTDVNGTSWVTPVKNQERCGGCWAFSAVGALESAAVITNYYKMGKAAPKPIPELSEQQLIDCAKPEGNKGCEGGLMDDAFKYVQISGGLCTESEYPYTAKDGSCKAKSCGTKYDPIQKYEDVTSDNEEALKAALFENGPISIAIEANQRSFQFYHSGVFDRRCGNALDHGVLLVGYGHDEEQGMDYWKIKNSWGNTWGDDGYIRICRNCHKNGDDGECGILMAPSYPIAK